MVDHANGALSLEGRFGHLHTQMYACAWTLETSCPRARNLRAEYFIIATVSNRRTNVTTKDSHYRSFRLRSIISNTETPSFKDCIDGSLPHDGATTWSRSRSITAAVRFSFELGTRRDFHLDSFRILGAALLGLGYSARLKVSTGRSAATSEE